MDHEEILLTIAVASDLHAYRRPDDKSSTYRSPSKLCLSDAEENHLSHPFAGLNFLIGEEKLKADIFLCPGDMTDRAAPDGVKYSWDQIHQSGKLLGAKLTTATVGNHDIDSRETTLAEDPKELLQQLNPKYPLPDTNLTNEFWAQNFTLYQGDNYSLLLLNTCVKHGKPEELERGYITIHTLNQLKKRIDSAPLKAINILLCHHHPHQHSELSLGDHDVMKNGQLLIDSLALNGNWLIIHGHKHHPKISYAAGGASSPIVFASGSFSGNFGPEAETRTRNQFHLVDIVQLKDKPYAFYGMVRSWNWAFGSGWVRSIGGAVAGMPPTAGFGTRLHPAELAKIVASKMVRSKLKKWDELCKSIPELNFQLPQDYEQFKNILVMDYKLSVEEDQGAPSQVGIAK